MVQQSYTSRFYAPDTARGSQRSAGSGRSKSTVSAKSSSARRRAAARKQAARRRQHITLMVNAVVLVLALSFLGMTYAYYKNKQGPVNQVPADVSGETLSDRPLPAGTHFQELDLGGLRPEEARALLSEQEATALGRLGQLTLRYAAAQGSEGTAPAATVSAPTAAPSETAESDPGYLKKTPYELGLRLDAGQMFERAYAGETSLRASYRIDEAALTAAVDSLAGEVNAVGQDARATGFDADSGKFLFAPEQEGRKLKITETQALVKKALESSQWKGIIELPVERSKPGRTAAELSQFLGYVSSASTPIMDWDEARSYNVQLAADRIHGTILQPGESFSYNRTVGAMTLANGFREAGVQDADGNSALGIGGGLCQPSTTLFQAAVRANLQIDVHNFHSQPVMYCPIGTDAMVSDWSDLVFTNTTNYPYAISAYFDGATLGFTIYGPQNPNGASIDLAVDDLGSEYADEPPRFIQDDSLDANEYYVKVKPRPSRHVQTYKTFNVNGNVSRELMYDHSYPAMSGVVAINNPSFVAAARDGKVSLDGIRCVVGSDGNWTVSMPADLDRFSSTGALTPDIQGTFPDGTPLPTRSDIPFNP